MLTSEKPGLQRIVLGNLPFLGISYQGRQRDEEYREKFSNRVEMKKVMQVALRYGIRYFATSSHGFNELAPTHLDVIRELEMETEIRLITCIGIPLEIRGKKINEYRRWKTHLSYEIKEFGKEVRERIFDDPILNCRPRWRENLRVAKPYKLKELENLLKINWKNWEDSIDNLSEYKIAYIEPGSETDFLAISRMDMLEELIDITCELGYKVLLGSHHLGASFPLIQERRVKRFGGFVTPVNKLGIMMFPSQRIVENAIKRTRKEGKLIVGIKPLAGGRIKPREALSYVYNKLKADSCMIGVGTVEEAEKDFQVARDILTNTRKP